MATLIYTLTDPRTNEVRYVGKTVKTLEQRLIAHTGDTRKNTHRRNWIIQLRRLGLRPLISLIETVADDGDWVAAERFWIAHYRKQGAKLTNLTDGGEGAPGNKVSEATKAKISKGNRGRRRSEATRQLISSYSSNRSEATRQKIRDAAARRQPPSAKTGKKISEAHRGKRHSDARRAAIAAGKLGKKASDTHRESLRLAWVRRKQRLQESVNA